GHGAQIKESANRCPRVEIALALLGIPERDEDLAGGQLSIGENFRPYARQGDLADGGGGLAVFELQLAFGQAKHRAPQCDRAGRNHENISALPVQVRDVLAKRFEPGPLDAALPAINEEGRADLDDDSLESFEAGLPS